jgi:hypothetical protein
MRPSKTIWLSTELGIWLRIVALLLTFKIFCLEIELTIGFPAETNKMPCKNSTKQRGGEESFGSALV